MVTIRMRSLQQLALGNLWQYPLRTILSVVAVALGVAMVVATNVISSGMRAAMLRGNESQNLIGFFASIMDVMLVLVVTVILAAAGFLIFNAFAMSVTQRRQYLGSLRALGMDRRQIRRLVISEALLTGVIGTIAGLVLGPLLGRSIIALMSAIGGQMFLFGASQLSIPNLALAAILGVGVTLLSSLIPARAAMRISPLAALREPEPAGVEAVSTWRTSVGAATLVAIGAYVLILPPGAWVKPPLDTILAAVFLLAWLGSLGLILPGLVGYLGRALRAPLSRRFGATGRLIADNLQRGRRRVLLTILTLATGLTMIVALTGIMTFFFKETLIKTMESAANQQVDIIAPFNVDQGIAGMAGKSLDQLQVSPEVSQDLRATLGDRAQFAELYVAFPPELSTLVPGMFSYLVSADDLRGAGSTFFTFSEGNWDSALAMMQDGCGLLISPALAAGHKIGDTLTITSPHGPLECKIAGLGTSPANVSMISGKGVKEAFNATIPLYLFVMPAIGIDQARYAADRDAVLARHQGVWVMAVKRVIEFQKSTTDLVLLSMNGILILAIVAAALGVVNTTMISVSERRQELGLLRAVGCTQRQVRAVVAGEAALMGILGGTLGLIAGAGLTVIVVMVRGVAGMGLTNVNLWTIMWNSVQPALITGIVGVIAAPFIAGAAAWIPARSVLRGTPIETLNVQR